MVYRPNIIGSIRAALAFMAKDEISRTIMHAFHIILGISSRFHCNYSKYNEFMSINIKTQNTHIIIFQNFHQH